MRVQVLWYDDPISEISFIEGVYADVALAEAAIAQQSEEYDKDHFLIQGEEVQGEKECT